MPKYLIEYNTPSNRNAWDFFTEYGKSVEFDSSEDAANDAFSNRLTKDEWGRFQIRITEIPEPRIYDAKPEESGLILGVYEI